MQCHTRVSHDIVIYNNDIVIISYRCLGLDDIVRLYVESCGKSCHIMTYGAAAGAARRGCEAYLTKSHLVPRRGPAFAPFRERTLVVIHARRTWRVARRGAQLRRGAWVSI
jgi:hypothetical protein